VLDITEAEVKTLGYDSLVKARGKFGDSVGALVFLCDSKAMTDLLLTTEAKNMQQGVMIGNQSGIYFPALNIVAVMSDRLPTATVGEDTVHKSLLCKQACMGYAQKLALDVVPLYKGNYVWQWDFVWRYAQMRNVQIAKEMIVQVKSLSNQD
jgi:hypothetical protein